MATLGRPFEENSGMSAIEAIKKYRIKRNRELSELMADFDEEALRKWIKDFMRRHQSYTSGMKFDYTNMCLMWLIEDDMAKNMDLLELREFYDGMREAWRIAKERKIVIPSYLDEWFTRTLAPDHRPPKKKVGRPTQGLFEHVICYCIHTAARHSSFKASRNDISPPTSICDFVAEAVELDFTTVKRIWVYRDREVFPKNSVV